jgi:hypothetical protein
MMLLSSCALIVVLLVIIGAAYNAHSSSSGATSASLPTSASPIGPSPSSSAAANVDDAKPAKASAVRSAAGDFSKAAVAIDGKPCAKVGT